MQKRFAVSIHKITMVQLLRYQEGAVAKKYQPNFKSRVNNYYLYNVFLVLIDNYISKIYICISLI